MRACVACLALFLACAVPCAAQQQPFRVFVNVGLQATSTTVSEQQSFDQYFEQGSFTLERPLPKSFFYDVGGTARLWRELHAGLAVSIFDNRGSGAVTARVPHPLLFNQPRTTTGDVDDIKRREIGQHITIGWRILVSPDLDFMVFGGPSVFTTEQTFLTALALSLDKEVFPFDTLPFPGAQTETQRENSVGYNIGVDMMWHLTRHVGAGVLVRYADAQTSFTPTGGQAVEVGVGGLHLGGGLRLKF